MQTGKTYGWGGQGREGGAGGRKSKRELGEKEIGQKERVEKERWREVMTKGRQTQTDRKYFVSVVISDWFPFLFGARKCEMLPCESKRPTENRTSGSKVEDVLSEESVQLIILDQSVLKLLQHLKHKRQLLLNTHTER